MPQIANADVDIENILSELGLEAKIIRGDWADITCPFHEDKSPSFSVHIDHGGWVCRHEDMRGGIIDLIAQVKGISKWEAAEWAKGHSIRDYDTEEILDRLYPNNEVDTSDIKAWSDRYDELSTKIMSRYWFHRGFTKKTLRQFGVRYDRSKRRLIWPVKDESANLTGFISRALPGTSKKRYDYPRGFNRILFPLDQFVGEEVILVEGSLDAIWLHQCGISGALAMLGSDLKDTQLRWLRGRTVRLTLALDNDRSGKLSTKALIKRLSGFDLWLLKIPKQYKDVQDMPKDKIQDAMKERTRAMFGVV